MYGRNTRDDGDVVVVLIRCEEYAVKWTWSFDIPPITSSTKVQTHIREREELEEEFQTPDLQRVNENKRTLKYSFAPRKQLHEYDEIHNIIHYPSISCCHVNTVNTAS